MKQLYMFDNRLNYRVLKERIEGIIGSVISDGTLSRHLQKMENDRLLNKVDAGRGGKVFYSLTIECKKKEQLHLLKFNPQYELFRGIYAYTFLCGMPDENSYASDNLQDILSEIHASKNDLFIDRTEKCHSDYQVESQLLNAREKQLQVFVRTYYKPIAGTFITESTLYRKNIFYQHCTEYITYFYNIPGISIKDFTGFYLFGPKVEDVQAAFECLLKKQYNKANHGIPW